MPTTMNDAVHRVEALLDELEEYATNAKKPFSGAQSNRIVDLETVREIVNDLREAVGVAYESARRVVRDREEILNDAEEEARQIVRDANAKAEVLGSEQEIVRRAQKQAGAIDLDAKARARQTVAWAKDEAESMFQSVEDQLKDVMEQLNNFLSQTGAINDAVMYYHSALSGMSVDPEAIEAPAGDYAQDGYEGGQYEGAPEYGYAEGGAEEERYA